MIVTFFLSTIVMFLAWILSFFPNGKIDLPTTNVNDFWSALDGVSCIMPISTLGVVIGLALAFIGIEFLWFLLNYILDKILSIIP